MEQGAILFIRGCPFVFDAVLIVAAVENFLCRLPLFLGKRRTVLSQINGSFFTDAACEKSGNAL